MIIEVHNILFSKFIHAIFHFNLFMAIFHGTFEPNVLVCPYQNGSENQVHNIEEAKTVGQVEITVPN